MTESEWFACSAPEPMLRFIAEKNSASRRLCLFALECCRRSDAFLANDVARSSLAVAERYREGNATPDEVVPVVRSWQDPPQGQVLAGNWVRVLLLLLDAYAPFIPHELSVALDASEQLARERTDDGIRTIVGNEEFANGELADQCHVLRDLVGNPFRPVVVEPGWRTAAVVQLAETIYEQRAFDRLPILADALEDVGCTNAVVLDHCRLQTSHVRGCWVVDLLTGRG